MHMDTARKPAGPFGSLFSGSEAAKVIDFLLSTEQHQTMTEIHDSTSASKNMINKIIEYLLDIGAIGIGAKRIEHIQNNKEKVKEEEDTYYIRDDTDTGKSIRELWYHLSKVQTEPFTFYSD